MDAAKLLRVILPAASVVLLCGCPSIQTGSPGQPEPVTAAGDYVHPASIILMPERVGAFRRAVILRYDAGGFDVSAGYDLANASNKIAATVYVYPGPSLTSVGSPPEVVSGARAHLTEGEFDRRKQEIQHVHPGAVLIEQEDTTRNEGGRVYPGKLAVFEYEDVFAGSRTLLRSELYVFCFVDGKWAVEYRFTHPRNENAEGQIQEFMRKWNWYGAANPEPL